MSSETLAKCARDLALAAAAFEEAGCLLAEKEQALSPSPEPRGHDPILALYFQGMHIFTKLLHPGNLLLGQAFHTLGIYMASKGVQSRSAVCLQQAAWLLDWSLGVLALHYPLGSPQLAFELALVGTCKTKAAELSDGAHKYRDALDAPARMLHVCFSSEGVAAVQRYVQEHLEGTLP